MYSTEACPREPRPRCAVSHGWRLFRYGVFTATVAGMFAQPTATVRAADYDPTQPRVEEVLDVDGSVWKVLIVPRPLYHPGATHSPVCPPAMPMMTPPQPPLLVPEPSEQPMPMEKTPPKADPPAEADKPVDDQALLSLDKTELIATQTEDPEPAVAAEPPMIPPIPMEKDLGVEIVPRFPLPVHAPSAACCGVDETASHVNPGDYLRVYRSIPFLRSEYIANPSYRHEATMEFLFGELRPTVVHKHPGQPRPHETMFPFENDYIQPYSYYSLGGGGYGRGPLPYGAPGAYGVNYNFYYPMPTVYRAY